MTTTEAPNSFNIKCFSPAGYDVMFTIRADDAAEFLERVTKLTAWLTANGYTPTARRPAPRGNGTPQVAPADAPVCQYHGPMKPSKFGGFYCPAKMGDGSYCKSKSDGPPRPPPSLCPSSRPCNTPRTGRHPRRRLTIITPNTINHPAGWGDLAGHQTIGADDD